MYQPIHTPNVENGEGGLNPPWSLFFLLTTTENILHRVESPWLTLQDDIFFGTFYDIAMTTSQILDTYQNFGTKEEILFSKFQRNVKAGGGGIHLPQGYQFLLQDQKCAIGIALCTRKFIAVLYEVKCNLTKLTNS